jgi:hypothetical protein
MKCLDEDATDGADMAVLFAALATNRVLLDLDLRDCSISDENWSVICESLQLHPSLTKLDLIGAGPSRSTT